MDSVPAADHACCSQGDIKAMIQGVIRCLTGLVTGPAALKKIPYVYENFMKFFGFRGIIAFNDFEDQTVKSKA